MKRFCLQVFAGIFASLLLLPMHVVFAVELASIYAVPTTHVKSGSANYTFYLTLDGSGSWAAGETMTLIFPSGYQLTSFTEDDVDVADDGVDFTTAATCAGSEHMAISFSGTAVTFEMCAGDGGSVASGSLLTIEMGLHAASSGTGANQVTNPASAGSYFIAFSGTFGSGGSVIVPIVESSGSGVSVTVSEPSSGGGSSGGGGGGGGGSSGGDETDEGSEGGEEGSGEEGEGSEGSEGEGEGEGEESEGSEGEESEGSEGSEGEVGLGSDEEGEVEEDRSGGREEVGIDAGDGAEDVEDPILSYDVGVSVDTFSLPVIDDTVAVLADTLAQLEIRIEEGDTDAVFIELGSERHSLVEVEEGIWRGDVPIGFANEVGSVILERGGDVVSTSPLFFDVLPSGAVYEIVDGASVGVSDALVTVFRADGLEWGSRITDDGGTGFAWYVPDGTYIVRVEKAGYETSDTIVSVSKNILAPTLFVVRVGEEPPIALGDSQDGQEENIVLPEVPEEPSGEVFERDVFSRVEDFFANVTSEEAAIVAAPVSVTVAIVATAAAGGGQFWLFLYSFFSQPLLFFARKKYRKLGVVYNAVTKVPLDLVTVRVYDVATQRLVKTVVSNREGAFFLRLSKEGKYRLHAVKSGFVFPSVYLQDVREDGAYTAVYAGQEIDVGKDAAPLAVSIPLDPEGSSTPARVLRWQRTKRRIALLFSPLSVFLALGIAFALPSVLSFVFLALQVALYVITWKLTHKRRVQNWGIVYDERTRRPVGNVVIRLFEPKYNKLVESVLSDARGRYVFALGPNEYYVTFAKEGYLDATVKPLDYRVRKDVSLFGIPLPLRRRDDMPHG